MSDIDMCVVCCVMYEMILLFHYVRQRMEKGRVLDFNHVLLALCHTQKKLRLINFSFTLLYPHSKKNLRRSTRRTFHRECGEREN